MVTDIREKYIGVYIYIYTHTYIYVHIYHIGERVNII